MPSAEEVVNAFIAAANRNDLEGMLALLDEKIEVGRFAASLCEDYSRPSLLSDFFSAFANLCNKNRSQYVNDPYPAPNHGVDAVRKTLSGSMGPTGRSAEVDWVILRQCASDTCVMNERIDRFKQKDGSWQEIPLMGTFDVKDGKITRWYDYFDAAKYNAQKEAAKKKGARL